MIKKGYQLKLDLIFGINTFIALTEFQRINEGYNCTTLKQSEFDKDKINLFGRINGVAGLKTLKLFLFDLKNK